MRALTSLLLSIVVVLHNSIAMAKEVPEPDVWVLVDASGSVAAVREFVVQEFAKVAPPLIASYGVIQWNDTLLPRTATLWPASVAGDLRSLRPADATMLSNALRDTFDRIHEKAGDCGRVVVVLHGAPQDKSVLKDVLSGSTSEFDFLALLLIADDELPQLTIDELNRLPTYAAPYDQPRAQQFSAVTLATALHQAGTHICPGLGS